jgi:hypothetical protein
MKRIESHAIECPRTTAASLSITPTKVCDLPHAAAFRYFNGVPREKPEAHHLAPRSIFASRMTPSQADMQVITRMDKSRLSQSDSRAGTDLRVTGDGPSRVDDDLGRHR